MKKIICILFCLIPFASFGYEDDFFKQYMSDKKMTLTKQEKKALSIASKWQTGVDTSKPSVGKDGAISFIFNSGQIQILCAVLQVCDIALESGEQVNGIEVGNPQYLIEPGITGFGKTEQIHLILKPKDAGINTSLVVTTSRRTYHFKLRSTTKETMPYVSFIYPDEVKAKWDEVVKRQALYRFENTLPETNEYLGNLHFDYKVVGSRRLKPCRIYNDGVKTIIEMQASIKQRDIPVLLVLRDRGFLRKKEKVIVNYRFQSNRYIVDMVFDKAVLISGTGATEERVIITRKA